MLPGSPPPLSHFNASNNQQCPPPVPPRPISVNFSGGVSQQNQPMFVGQPNAFMPSPYTAVNGIPNYNCYQQGGASLFSNPWTSVQPKHSFIITAEESSKNAFQAIESVVNALVSVANMLNTTHSAVFNTFRAVAGVAQQFSTFKIYLFSSVLVPIVRWCRFLWRHLLSLLRVRPRNYANAEEIWTNIQQHQQNVSFPSGAPFASLLFWLIALGGPLLIFRCVLRLAEREAEASKWTTGQSEHYTAQALFDFCAANANELSFSAFDMIRIAPKSEQPNVKDWLLASTFDGSKVGLVPISYVKLIGKCTDKNSQTL